MLICARTRCRRSRARTHTHRCSWEFCEYKYWNDTKRQLLRKRRANWAALINVAHASIAYQSVKSGRTLLLLLSPPPRMKRKRKIVNSVFRFLISFDLCLIRISSAVASVVFSAYHIFGPTLVRVSRLWRKKSKHSTRARAHTHTKSMLDRIWCVVICEFA